MSRLFPLYRTDSRRGRRALSRLIRRREEVLDREVLTRARRLVQAVRRRGDRALLAAARRFDGSRAETVADLALVPPPDLGEADALPPGFSSAFARAAGAVERYHRHQLHPGFRLEEDGVELEELRRPLSRVGIYVPGGRAAYPSTALMTVVPARIAGVQEIVVVTPPRAYRESPSLRYALAALEVEEVWGMGGAHAVAALAYGTETVRRVDKIVGPGNAWVTAAKRLVSADVGIDGLAGPSEVVIVADAGADPALVATDLLAQAEHDELAAPILVTPERRLARRVVGELEDQLAELATAETARVALSTFGCAFVVAGMEEALGLVEAIAPEHLQLLGPAAEELAPRVRSAGAVFLGASTPEVFGDYVAGPSHVLPTCGSARFASALGVEDFLRRSHLVRFSPAAAGRWAEAAAALAEAEGLPAHAASARRRLP